jgi:hypothetical protein
MKHSTVFLIGTLLSLATAIFSVWFFAVNQATFAGLVLGTGFMVVAGISTIITNILIKEGE